MDGIYLNQKAEIEKCFTADEVKAYAMMSKDTNPVHFDLEYATRTRFKKPIVHGLLTASLVGGLLGTTLPGKGTIHIGQKLRFINPVFVDETITASIEVTNIRPDKSIITFQCKVIKEDGSLAIEGEAVVMYLGDFFI